MEWSGVQCSGMDDNENKSAPGRAKKWRDERPRGGLNEKEGKK